MVETSIVVGLAFEYPIEALEFVNGNFVVDEVFKGKEGTVVLKDLVVTREGEVIFVLDEFLIPKGKSVVALELVMGDNKVTEADPSVIIEGWAVVVICVSVVREDIVVVEKDIFSIAVGVSLKVEDTDVCVVDVDISVFTVVSA